jgi:hypothetical protein
MLRHRDGRFNLYYAFPFNFIRDQFSGPRTQQMKGTQIHMMSIGALQKN